MNAHALAPTPEDPLRQLLAAVLLVDPSASVLDQTENALRVQVTEPAAGSALLVLLRSPADDSALALARVGLEIDEALAGVTPGTFIQLVGVDPQSPELEALLKRRVPSVLAQVRSRLGASLWKPGQDVKVVRGAGSSVLKKAVARANAGGLPDAAEVASARESQAEEAQGFLQRLGERPPVVTWSLAALSALLFGLQLAWGGADAGAAAARMGAALSGLIAQGQVWRLLASTVLHANVIHLVMNLVALFSFGTFLERFLGSRRYLLLYVLSGLGGSVASFFRPEEALSVGASGGVWGLMVAGAVLVSAPRGRLPPFLALSLRKRAWSPVLVNALYSFSPGVDLLAHFGGGAVGALLVFSGLLTLGIPAHEARGTVSAPPSEERAWVKLSALVAGLMLLASVAAALVTGKPWELRRTPSLTRTELPGNAASIALPPLISPATHAAAHTFGTLRYDPAAVIVWVSPTPLGEEEAKDPHGQLVGLTKELEQPISGFTVDTKYELRQRGDVSYVYSHQAASDGRTGESFWFIQGRRYGRVLLLRTGDVPKAWEPVLAELPFTLELRADAPAKIDG